MSKIDIEFVPGDTIEHIRTGDTYEVMSSVKLKLPDGSWVDGLLYCDEDGMEFVRSTAEMQEKFQPYTDGEDNGGSETD